MLSLLQDKPTEVIQLSYWVFAIWWVIILSVHITAVGYASLYAYCYVKLQDTSLNFYFEPFQIGMPPPHHRTIAIVHAVMAALHTVFIFLMLSGSIWQRSLAFTPWTSSNAEENTHEEDKNSRTSSVVLRSFTTVYTTVSDRHGICGVNSDYFHVVLIVREVIETALQTSQAYRMSVLLPRTILNRFYVLLLVTNCWSSVVVYSTFFKGDEARRRFVCVVLDCMLDLMACVGVGLLVLLNYIKYYSHDVRGFDDSLWRNDEWAARAINEFRMVVVTSWSDLASRAIFSFGLIMTASSIKTLLQRLPRNGSSEGKQSKAPNVHNLREALHRKLNTVVPQPPAVSVALPSQVSKSKLLVKIGRSFRATKLRTRTGQTLLNAAHILFGAWGIVILGFHTHASIQPTLPQCLMQVRPWGATRPSYYLVGLDCYTLAISGKKDEVEEKWSEFDSSTVVQLLIRHCPALEMPDSIRKLHGLHGIKAYNTTILDWGESAALTNANHPDLVTLYLARVNMTDGVLPMGLTDGLDSKRHQQADLEFEYSQLVAIPTALLRLEPMFFALTGNPITDIPPEVFELPGLATLGLGQMDLKELPRNVGNLSPTLRAVFLDGTRISFFWPWADELITRDEEWSVLVVTDTPYCADLQQIQSGSASTFSAPPSLESASIPMDPTQAIQPPVSDIVRCGGFVGTYYFINLDDDNMAISPPPPLQVAHPKSTVEQQCSSI